MTHNTASAAAPQAGRAVSIDDALAQARATLDDARFAPLFEAGGVPEAPAVLVTAPPRRGRTMLAVAAAMRAMDVFGESAAVLAVPNRVLADEYSPLLIRHAGVSTQARPATTLNALAFRLITQARARAGLPLPKLLNGAEQDALLRRVLGVHLAHVQAGEMCATCQLLRDYFANEHWARYVAEDMREGEHGGDPATTETLFSAGVNGAFTAQLRDMLARMDESGAGPGCEQRVLAATDGAGITGARLAIQWRLAFALRAEYIAMIGAQYPREPVDRCERSAGPAVASAPRQNARTRQRVPDPHPARRRAATRRRHGARASVPFGERRTRRCGVAHQDRTPHVGPLVEQHGRDHA